MENKEIEQLFFNQIKNLTTKTTRNTMRTYDYQFSDQWTRGI